jgi:hypothetical protein
MLQEYPDTRHRLELEYPRAVLMAASLTIHQEYIRYLNKHERLRHELKYVDIQTRHRQELHTMLCLMPSLALKALAAIQKRAVRNWTPQQILYLGGLWRLRHALAPSLQQRIEGLLFGHPSEIYRSWQGRFKDEAMIEDICREKQRRSDEESLLHDHKNVSAVFEEALRRIKAPQEIKEEEYYELVGVPALLRQWQERAGDFSRRFGPSPGIETLQSAVNEAMRDWDVEMISLERDKEIIRKFRERAEMVYEQLCAHAAYADTDETAGILLRKRIAKRLKLMEDLPSDALILVTPFMRSAFLTDIETLSRRIKSIKAQGLPDTASSALAEQKELPVRAKRSFPLFSSGTISKGAYAPVEHDRLSFRYESLWPITNTITRQGAVEDTLPIIAGAR